MTIKLKPIRCDDDLTQAFRDLERVFDAKDGTPEADVREILLALIERYENEHYPIPHADPVSAICFVMEQQGLSRSDLTAYLGAKSKVCEVLNGKRPLSLTMIKKLHKGLKIPYESLLT